MELCSNDKHGAVLVVDDDENVLMLLRILLEEAGFEVACSANGADALRFLEENPPPCLILLDLRMPLMSGEEFRRAQLADARFANIPVVILSAASDLHEKASELEAEVAVAKPFDVFGLREIVERICWHAVSRQA